MYSGAGAQAASPKAATAQAARTQADHVTGGADRSDPDHVTNLLPIITTPCRKLHRPTRLSW